MEKEQLAFNFWNCALWSKKYSTYARFIEVPKTESFSLRQHCQDM